VRARCVEVAMVVVLAVAVAEPYKWFHESWYLHAWWRVLPGYSLLLSGAVLLAVMAYVELRRVPSAASINPT